jgi:hypothetical protein
MGHASFTQPGLNTMLSDEEDEEERGAGPCACAPGRGDASSPELAEGELTAGPAPPLVRVAAMLDSMTLTSRCSAQRWERGRLLRTGLLRPLNCHAAAAAGTRQVPLVLT